MTELLEDAPRSGATPAPTLIDRYRSVRSATEWIVEPLEVEDYVVQSMPDVSPAKWHLAHTTWFFETFVLATHDGDRHRPFDPDFGYLFNSYYESVGDRHARPRRGLLTRPTVARVLEYRRHVDDRMVALLERGDDVLGELAPVVELGLHHEQQHQELLLTDLLHVFSVNPLDPACRALPELVDVPARPLTWTRFDEGVRRIGVDPATAGFHFDNEAPRHRVYLEPFELADRPVTNAEYLAFVEDGGYGKPTLWLSEGWARVQTEGWEEPLHWRRGSGGWRRMTLGGLVELEPQAPVCHLSYYEADAFARWAGARLPTEFEWETAAAGRPVEGHLFDPTNDPRLRPAPGHGAGLRALFGDVWEWTSSSYAPYPGYRPTEGALGEYNGKFMCNQYVLRGGSCATPVGHVRPTYRNFFPAHSRWQFAGLRLAREV